MATIKRSRVNELLAKEEKRYVVDHPKSKKLYNRARKTLLGGVPMHWMVQWAGPYPMFVDRGKGVKIVDVDGNEYVDFCLGDTGSMFGHSPDAIIEAVTKQVKKGITMMLPTEDSIWVGEELVRRFGLPYWQIVMTATDANRYSIRLAREATRRKKILVINGCYHGTVDETLATIRNGKVVARKGNAGAPVDPAVTTKIVEFNDIPAVKKALKDEDVALFMLEPAMTNHGIILPDPGYHEEIRELTERYGTLLLLDETHTLSCGIGGYTREHKLKPDMMTMGKPLASGVPVAAYGINKAVADMVLDHIINDNEDEEMGVGGTLSGNALAVAAMRATLQKVYTQSNFDRMLPLAQRFYDGVEGAIRESDVPWCSTRLGIRIEYDFMPRRPRNGAEVDAMDDMGLDHLMHLWALNRGILLTPFHMMALISPSTTKKHVDMHTEMFRGCTEALLR